MNAFTAVIVLVIVFSIYFLPTIRAGAEHHRNFAAIFYLNLFLGWTFVGWVIALVWAVSKPAPESRVHS